MHGRRECWAAPRDVVMARLKGAQAHGDTTAVTRAQLQHAADVGVGSEIGVESERLNMSPQQVCTGTSSRAQSSSPIRGSIGVVAASLPRMSVLVLPSLKRCLLTAE